MNERPSGETRDQKVADTSIFLELDKNTQVKLLRALHGEGLADSKNNIWERLIVGGELALLGLNVREELTDEEKRLFIQELNSLRGELEEKAVPIDYTDLARSIYRFQNIGLEFNPLTEEEREGIMGLPDLFRQNKELRGHLNYLPQIASALGKNVTELSQPEDFILARQAIEGDLRNTRGTSREFEVMALAGLLVEISDQEAENLINNQMWSQELWEDVRAMIENLKTSSEENSGYILVRLLPPFLRMDSFIEKQKSRQV